QYCAVAGSTIGSPFISNASSLIFVSPLLLAFAPDLLRDPARRSRLRTNLVSGRETMGDGAQGSRRTTNRWRSTYRSMKEHHEPIAVEFRDYAHAEFLDWCDGGPTVAQVTARTGALGRSPTVAQNQLGATM